MYIDERQTVHTTNQKKKRERKKELLVYLSTNKTNFLKTNKSFCWDINDKMSINDIR